VNISKTVADRLKLLLMTNSKSHMSFRLAQRSMTLDDLELYKFEFSASFSGFRRFRTQQQLNASRSASIVSDNVVGTSNWSNNGMLSRRAGLSATAGLSCLSLTVNISKTVADTAKVIIND